MAIRMLIHGGIWYSTSGQNKESEKINYARGVQSCSKF